MSNTFRYRLNGGAWIERTGIPFRIPSAQTDVVEVAGIGSSVVLAADASVTTYTSAVIGQSENVIGWLDNGAFNTSQSIYPAVADDVDVEITIPAIANDNSSSPEIYRVTQANADARNIAPGAVSIANLWHLGADGAALRLAGVCRSGTGMQAMLDNDNDTRSFFDDANTVAVAEAAWGPIERVLYNWYVADAPGSHTLATGGLVGFFGLNADGSDVDFALRDIDHCLIDKRAVQTGGDLGLFGPETRVDVMYPGPQVLAESHFNPAIDPPKPNYTTNNDGSAIGGRVEANGPPAFAQRREFVANSPAENRGVATVAPALAKMGDYQGGQQLPGNAQVATHPALQSKYGQVLYSQDIAFALLCGHGFAHPTRLDRVEVETSGAYADFIFALPSGARLRTHRDVDGLTVSNPRPHQQEVMGFVIRRSGDTARTERPVYRTDLATSGSDLTNYPPAYRGTVEIQGDGSTGVVRITPEEPFENGDVITFGYDGHYGTCNLHGPEDYDAELFLDGLRAYEPRLDDGTAYRYPGAPVVNQEIHTVAGLAGGNPVPLAPVVAKTDTTAARLNGPAVGAVTALTMVFEGTIGAQSGNGTRNIMRLSSDGLRLYARTDGNRAVRLKMEDGIGNALVNNVLLGNNTMAPIPDTMRMMITATQDDGTGTWRCAYYLNDALVGSEFTGPSTANAFFQAGQSFEMGADGFPMGMGRMMIWSGSHADAFSPDGLLPTAPPRQVLQGDADYWNGNSAPVGWTKAGLGVWSDL